MNIEQWQRKRSLKYVGYNLAYHIFTWDTVISISDVYIGIEEPLKVEAYYTINFTSGKHLRKDARLPTQYTLTRGIFKMKKNVPVTSADVYFNAPCEALIKIEESRIKAVRAFIKFKHITLKR